MDYFDAIARKTCETLTGHERSVEDGLVDISGSLIVLLGTERTELLARWVFDAAQLDYGTSELKAAIENAPDTAEELHAVRTEYHRKH